MLEIDFQDPMMKLYGKTQKLSMQEMMEPFIFRSNTNKYKK